jgi:hypothetical protein
MPEQLRENDGPTGCSGSSPCHAARRSPPYPYRDSRNGDRPAGHATRERECRGRNVGPFRGIRFNAMAALSAPGEPVWLPKGGTTRSGEHGLGREASRFGVMPRSSRRIAECHRRAGRGFRQTPSPVSSAMRRVIMLGRRQRLADRLWSEFGENNPQDPNTGRKRVAIILDDV